MPRADLHNSSSNSALEVTHKEIEEKRAKREIANMNERRRMQNINAGFHSLRALLPQKHDGEKLSKAAILQHTAAYIYQLEQEIAKLLTQNSELKRVVGGSAAATVNTNTSEWVKRLASNPPDCPSCKRRKYESNHRLDIDSSPMGGEGSSTESSSEHEMNSSSKYQRQSRNKAFNGKTCDQGSLRKQLTRVERQLEEERRVRTLLEEELNYQGKTVNLNGRQYIQAPLEHVTDEVEVASESIEIEMHSCPASPPDVMMSSNEHLTSGSMFTHSNQYQSNKLVSEQRVQKQNAIALPIDVPFVAPSEVVDNSADSTTVKSSNTNGNGPLVVLLDSNGVMSLIDSSKLQSNTNGTTSSSASTQPQILQLVSNNSNSKVGTPTILTAKRTTNITSNLNGVQITKTASLPEAAKTSRQNLNTIVEAIRHLEGDHLFENRDKTIKVMKIKKEENDQEAKAAKICPDPTMEVESSTEIDSGHIVSQQSKPNNQNEHETLQDDPQVILNNLASGTASVGSIAPSSEDLSCSTSTTPTSAIPNGSESSSPIYTTTSSTSRPQIIQRPNVIVVNSVDN